MFITALILVPAFGLVAWAWLSMAQVEEELRGFNGFEGLHFESDHHAVTGPQGAA
jgi:hypothetical protein